jgi:tetratricopeptide (TPR) repeat protein
MQAVTSFLTNAAAVKPMLVILEDLHDADKGTLEMLSYVSRNLAGTRLLVVGTYRDVEVDRSHPLSAALAELRRVSSFGRVLLRGLNIDEVRRMLESLTQEVIPVGLAEAVHRQTEGNPLFVQEVVRYLTEEKLLTRESGRLSTSGDTALEMSIPEGLRDVIGKRLSNLSQECNELLSFASVISREFPLDTLKAVADMDDATFVNALKEAVQLSILEERSQVGEIRYRFTHAFFRQTLYEELIAPQRLYIHQQVARSMEKLYEKRLEEHASELAEHFSHSTDHADLEKAVNYGEMAARRAMGVYAYSEAARLLDQTIKVQKILDPDDKEKLCDLILDLCDALYPIPDTTRIIEVEAPAAFSLAEELNDNSRAVRACGLANKALFSERLFHGLNLMEEWGKRADKYALPDTPERALVDASIGSNKMQKGEFKEGSQILLGALDQARRLNDPNAIQQITGMLLVRHCAPRHTAERVKIATEYWEDIKQGKKHVFGANDMLMMYDAYLTAGLRQEASKFYKDIRSIVEKTGNFHLEQQALVMEQLEKTMDGNFEEPLRIGEDIIRHGEQVGGMAFLPGIAFMGSERALIYLGKSYELGEEYGYGRSFEGRVYNCRSFAYKGQNEDVDKILERYVINRQNFGADEDIMPSFVDTTFLEASVLIGNLKATEMLYNRLKNTDVRTGGMRSLACTARFLGGAAVLLDRYDEAREHFDEAIKVCTDMRFRPELALSRLGLAELLLDHYPDEKAEALKHLDFAIKEFHEMKIQPSLERALRRKDILKA